MFSHYTSMKLFPAPLIFLLLFVAGCGRKTGPAREVSAAEGQMQTFVVTGLVTEIRPALGTVVIQHGDIPKFMPAMTMPFKLKNTNQLGDLNPGDAVSFQLHAGSKESWIDNLILLRRTQPAAPPAASEAAGPGFKLADIPNFSFTNELNQPVSLRDYSGQAIGLTFFFTRCPIPEFCPRLSRNFQEASKKLASIPNPPANWHLFSISFDPFDQPGVLKAYAQQYHYDPAHWSFLTGPPDQIRELAAGFGLTVSSNGGLFDHSFQTAVFDAQGRLQSHWPIGGDTTEPLVQEILKAAAATNAGPGR